MAFEHLREPHDAALAADAADLNRLVAAARRQAIERSTRSAQTASQPVGAADLELPVGLAASRVEAVERDRAARRASSATVSASSRSGWISLPCGPKRDAAQRFCSYTPRSLGSNSRGGASSAHSQSAREQRTSAAVLLDRRRLIRRPDLERPEARMQTDVPPEARVVASRRRSRPSARRTPPSRRSRGTRAAHRARGR